MADGFHGIVCAFFHWLSLCCLLGGVIAPVRKAVECHKWIWIPYTAVCLALAPVVYVIWRPQKPDSKVTPAIIAVAHQPPDYIEGTKFTHAQLHEMFPFGYTVIYFSGNRRFRDEVVRTAKLEWKLDVDNITIEPDFSAGTVRWTLPNVSTEGNLRLKVNRLTLYTKLQAGSGGTAPVYVRNQPGLYVLTLSDNQHSPVFLVGYRIIRGSEFPRPKNLPTPKKVGTNQ